MMMMFKIKKNYKNYRNNYKNLIFGVLTNYLKKLQTKKKK
jgi:hypothetical protein